MLKSTWLTWSRSCDLTPQAHHYELHRIRITNAGSELSFDIKKCQARMGFEPKLTLCIGIVLLSGAANCKKHFTFVIVCN